MIKRAKTLKNLKKTAKLFFLCAGSFTREEKNSIIKVACFMLNLLSLKSKASQFFFLGSIQPQHTVYNAVSVFLTSVSQTVLHINCHLTSFAGKMRAFFFIFGAQFSFLTQEVVSNQGSTLRALTTGQVQINVELGHFFMLEVEVAKNSQK